ncbi:MAG: nucleotidyltransferase family protein [Vulcanimicrobiota bacterium]
MKTFDTLVNMMGPAPRPQEVDDWPDLIALARRHKLLLPLANTPGLPPEVQAELSSEVTMRSLSEIHRAGQLVELVKLFQENGIEVLSFKGLTLAQLAHGRVTGRECIDIDLLVRPEDFQRSLILLLGFGFQYEMENLPRCYTKFHYGVPLCNQAKNLTIDLHYQLFSGGVHFPTECIWEASEAIEIQGYPVPTFRAEHLFVYLALHGTKHYWSQLRWLYDLKALHSRIDLAQTELFARVQKCERALGLALGLLEQLWGTGQPIEPMPSLLGDSLSRLKGERLSWPQYHRFQYQCQSNVQQRLKLLLYTWFTPQIHDLRLIDLPSQLWFVYYALRPARVLGEFLLKGLKRV